MGCQSMTNVGIVMTKTEWERRLGHIAASDNQMMFCYTEDIQAVLAENGRMKECIEKKIKFYEWCDKMCPAVNFGACECGTEDMLEIVNPLTFPEAGK